MAPPATVWECRTAYFPEPTNWKVVPQSYNTLDVDDMEDSVGENVSVAEATAVGIMVKLSGGRGSPVYGSPNIAWYMAATEEWVGPSPFSYVPTPLSE
jgi:hypothetical protein